MSRRRAFFIDSPSGRLFALYHEPVGVCRGKVLHLPAFADEMNKSRHMVNQQAQKLAQAGYAVLLFDLYGTGESDGDFGQASWAAWQNDATVALQWLQQQYHGPAILWSHRAGSLLAADLMRKHDFEAWLMWQPVLNGKQFLNQFLRLKVVQCRMLGQQASMEQLLKRILMGETLEVGGYAINPRLFVPMDQQRLHARSLDAGTRVLGLEAGNNQLPLKPPVQQLLKAWRDKGVDCHWQVHNSPAFWNTNELTNAASWLPLGLEIANGTLRQPETDQSFQWQPQYSVSP